MAEFKKYKRSKIAEIRDLEPGETVSSLVNDGISVSQEDRKLKFSVFSEGKVARDPKNHKDKRYINPEYFKENFQLANEDY